MHIITWDTGTRTGAVSPRDIHNFSLACELTVQSKYQLTCLIKIILHKNLVLHYVEQYGVSIRQCSHTSLELLKVLRPAA